MTELEKARGHFFIVATIIVMLVGLLGNVAWVKLNEPMTPIVVLNADNESGEAWWGNRFNKTHYRRDSVGYEVAEFDGKSYHVGLNGTWEIVLEKWPDDHLVPATRRVRPSLELMGRLHEGRALLDKKRRERESDVPPLSKAQRRFSLNFLI